MKILFTLIFFIFSQCILTAETGQLNSEPSKDGTVQGEFLALYTYASNIVVISPGRGDSYLLVRAVDRFFQIHKNVEVKSIKTSISANNGSMVMTIIVRPKTEETRKMNNISEIDIPKPEKG